MSAVPTSIRLEKEIKDEASLLAKKLWLSLGTVISIYLKKFIAQRWISVTEDELEWRTVVDFWEKWLSASELLGSLETTHD